MYSKLSTKIFSKKEGVWVSLDRSQSLFYFVPQDRSQSSWLDLVPPKTFLNLSLTSLMVDLSRHWFFQDADSVEFTRQKGGGLAGRELEQRCALSQLP